MNTESLNLSRDSKALSSQEIIKLLQDACAHLRHMNLLMAQKLSHAHMKDAA